MFCQYGGTGKGIKSKVGGELEISLQALFTYLCDLCAFECTISPLILLFFNSALLTHSKCTQPTQVMCSPYTLRMHSTNWNQGLSLHTQNALSHLKWSALLTHSQCTQPIQIKTYNAGMWTHAHPMLRNTSKEHQSSLCAPPNLRWPPNFLKLLQGSKSASKNPPELKLALPTNTKPQDLSQCTEAIKPLIMQLTWVGP